MIVEACDVLCHFPGELRWGGQWLVSGKKEEQEQEDPAPFTPRAFAPWYKFPFGKFLVNLSGLDWYFWDLGHSDLTYNILQVFLYFAEIYGEQGLLHVSQY